MEEALHVGEVFWCLQDLTTSSKSTIRDEGVPSSVDLSDIWLRP